MGWDLGSSKKPYSRKCTLIRMFFTSLRQISDQHAFFEILCFLQQKSNEKPLVNSEPSLIETFRQPRIEITQFFKNSKIHLRYFFNMLSNPELKAREITSLWDSKTSTEDPEIRRKAQK